MAYYSAKLNLGPDIIREYTKSGKKSGMEQLKSIVIPTGLGMAFHSENNSDINNLVLKYKKEASGVEQVLNSEEYIFFSQKHEILLREYKKVIERNIKVGGIEWSDEYLNRTKSEMKQSLVALKRSYPVLKSIVADTPDDIVMKKVPGNQQFGQGRRYLIESEKINRYLSSGHSIFDKYDFYYWPEKEYICLEDNIYEEQFVALIKDIELDLNLISQKMLGPVSINPLYQDVAITGKSKRTEFEVVYPNGARRRKGQMGILDPAFEKTQSEKIGIIFKGATFTEEKLKAILEMLGGSRYIKQVKNNGNTILRHSVKKVDLPGGEDDDANRHSDSSN